MIFSCKCHLPSSASQISGVFSYVWRRHMSRRWIFKWNERRKEQMKGIKFRFLAMLPWEFYGWLAQTHWELTIFEWQLEVYLSCPEPDSLRGISSSGQFPLYFFDEQYWIEKSVLYFIKLSKGLHIYCVVVFKSLNLPAHSCSLQKHVQWIYCLNAWNDYN